MKIGVGVVLDVLYQKVTECVSSLDGIIVMMHIRVNCFPDDSLLEMMQLLDVLVNSGHTLKWFPVEQTQG